MENYKNSKIGLETAKKYGDILEMERPQTEESLRKHPRDPSEPCQNLLALLSAAGL